MIFELRQYDKTLMTFEFEKKHLEGQACRIISINNEYNNLLPLGMVADDDGILSWLKTRVVPKNREYVDQLLSKKCLN
ncbi:MAG: hypothetical protein RR413_04005 [Christensenellaceae bacterium]